MKKRYIALIIIILFIVVIGNYKLILERGSAITNKGYSIPPSKNSLITIDGATFPVNRILVGFPENITRKEVREIANSINATIVGYALSTNSYQFEVKAITDEELQNFINSLEGNPKIEYAFRNYMTRMTFG